MNADEIIKKAQEDFARLSKIPVDGVVGLSKTDEGWVVSLEALERKSIPIPWISWGCMKSIWTMRVTFSTFRERSCVSAAKPKRRDRKGGKRGQVAPEIGKPMATLEGATGNKRKEAHPSTPLIWQGT